jgi:NADH-quinone oxidoreductase subunit M
VEVVVMTDVPGLTLLTLAPVVGGLVVAGVPAERGRLARGLAFVFSGLSLLITVWLMTRFDRTNGGFQFTERHTWIGALGVDYHVGMDGLSLVMVVLTALLVPFAVLMSVGNSGRTPLYLALVLFLQGGLYGTFTALNFFHWFLFWELSLVPAFFLVRLWGGPECGRAAVQFFLYTMVGSVALLLAFLTLYRATGTFDFVDLASQAGQGELSRAMVERSTWGRLSGSTVEVLAFVGILLGLAVKVPMVPFHSWLPPAYAEAPSAITMLLTGLMSKMGMFGILRILVPIFPDQLREWSAPLIWMGVGTVVLGAVVSVAQSDLKRLLAFSSINHLGYCLVGVFAVTGAAGGAELAADRSAALSGVVLQMFNHGLTAAALFGFVACLEARTGGKRGLGDFGGLRQVVPVFAGLMGFALFSSLGLPGLNGFVGEFLLFKGTFGLAPAAAAVSTLGLLFTALALLNLIHRVFNGPLNERWASLPDLSTRERWVLAPPVLLMLLLGVYPQAAVVWFNATLLHWLGRWG